ncbi:MAG: peptidoglycan-associated lipoprotein Pal [Rhodospirillales bacterium]|nr:peptidoglycan-associated lipoprotein Pal [Rhodospirillales bacterium]MCB9980706.1 peptidoglycan-associated lipoprotein Pal [Rhodospirillales bacterium]
MTMRLFFMMFAVLLVSACSSTDNAADSNGLMGDKELMTGTDSLDGVTATGMPIPGSNEDLVVSVGDRVFFGYDQYNLTDEARNVLGMQAEWLKQYPNVSVTIEGHADERGTREYNLALGDRRATSVKNYLIANGIDPMRIHVISYGKERPAVEGSNPSAWAQNRRGVTVVE